MHGWIRWRVHDPWETRQSTGDVGADAWCEGMDMGIGRDEYTAMRYLHRGNWGVRDVIPRNGKRVHGLNVCKAMP